MSELPTPPGQGPDSPGTPSEGSQASASAAHGRSRLKKFLTPLVLFALGVTPGLVAFFVVYPSPETGIPLPDYPSLEISTNEAIYRVVYSVIQVPPATAELVISVRQQVLPSKYSGKLITPIVTVTLPLGFTFRDCHFPYCANRPTEFGSTWYQPLAFRPFVATAVFPINSSRFAVNFNGIDAYAAIPEVSYQYSFGLTTPSLLASYQIPSAGTYDWSSIPTAAVSKSGATWEEAIAKGDTAGRVASGVDHGRETRDADLTFLAGAMLGLAGGAILSAIQETLHAWRPTAD